jgi:type II secretory pathway pseudopilin PulG
LSCEPVIAIGWPELVILFVIIVILLGPLMFRLYRFLDKVQKASKAEEKKKK